MRALLCSKSDVASLVTQPSSSIVHEHYIYKKLVLYNIYAIITLQVINKILERKDRQPVKVDFKIYLTENTVTRWEAVSSLQSCNHRFSLPIVKF